ncbi:MAG: hypothetical protein LBG61_03090 [Burkholderiales bacterium]|jgi:hypothetical protein|nr:hypothetical protein [Burkholderiales bacterium]
MYPRLKHLTHLFINTGKITTWAREVSCTDISAMQVTLENFSLPAGSLRPMEQTPYLIKQFILPDNGTGIDLFLPPSPNNPHPTLLVTFFVVPTEAAANYLWNALSSSPQIPYTLPPIPQLPFCASLKTDFAPEFDARIHRLCQSAAFYWMDNYCILQPKTPDEQLSHVTADYPKLYKAVSEKIQKKPNDQPGCVFLDRDAWADIVTEEYGFKLVHPSEFIKTRTMTITQTWSYTRGCYRFDATLLEELTKSSLSGDIPTDVLQRLPEYCVYIEMPEGFQSPWFEGVQLYGFFVTMEYTDEKKLLFSTLPLSEPKITPIQFRLSDISMEEEAERICANTVREFPSVSPEQLEKFKTEFAGRLKFFINCALYFCSAEPDIEGVVAGTSPARPALKKTKQGFQLFPATKTKIYNVGAKVGKLIRTYQSEEDQKPAGDGKTHASPRPHIRTAHWHLYHVGQGRKDSRVRWIPPIVVGTFAKK